MTIHLPEARLSQLSVLASNAGYESVEEFVSDHLVALAEQQNPADLEPMSEEEMQASLEMIDRGMEDIAAGRYYTLEEARRRSLAKLREKQG